LKRRCNQYKSVEENPQKRSSMEAFSRFGTGAKIPMLGHLARVDRNCWLPAMVYADRLRKGRVSHPQDFAVKKIINVLNGY
jgi:hypothetical protein